MTRSWENTQGWRYSKLREVNIFRPLLHVIAQKHKHTQMSAYSTDVVY